MKRESLPSEQLIERLFAASTLLCGTTAIEINGMTLTPDESKAYIEYNLSHSWPVITAYGTTLHPGTVAHSFLSMLHQVFNLEHRMKSYLPPEDQANAHDAILGTIVAVEFPKTPYGGWKLEADKSKAPGIRAVSAVAKAAERVPRIFGEHLGGRHKWTVSMEVNYSLIDSGFVVMNRQKGTTEQRRVMDASTPKDWPETLGYVPCIDSPDDLLDCFNFKKRAVDGAWAGLPVSLMKGGIGADGKGGRVHYAGVGLVRYGAEREAEIQRLLASDPDALFEAERSARNGGLAVMMDYFRKVVPLEN